MPGRDGVYLLVTASRGEYVYQPFTEQNGNENEWRRNVLAAHRELLDWISQGAGPCPAHIGWNVYGKPLLEHAELVDRYEGGQLAAGQCSQAFRLRYRDASRTLTDEEVEVAHSSIRAALEKQLGALLRS